MWFVFQIAPVLEEITKFLYTNELRQECLRAHETSRNSFSDLINSVLFGIRTVFFSHKYGFFYKNMVSKRYWLFFGGAYNCFLLEQKVWQVLSHYYGSLACEKPFLIMNIQFCLYRLSPLFLVRLTQKPVSYKSCLLNPGREVHRSLHKWKLKASNCLATDVKFKYLARSTRLWIFDDFYANLPFVIWSVHSFTHPFIWSLTWKAAGRFESRFLFFLVTNLARSSNRLVG